jgi:hypothetical protein
VDLFVHIFWEEHNGSAIIISAPRSIKVHGDFFFSRPIHIIFGSVRFLSKKITKPKLFLKKKNRNRTETGSNRPVSVRFGFLGQKPVQTGLPWFFRFGSVFSVFSVWLGFGSVFFGFGSVRFFAYKTETEPNRPVFLKF